MEACASDKAMRNRVILSKIPEKFLLFVIKILIDNEINKMIEVISAKE